MRSPPEPLHAAPPERLNQGERELLGRDSRAIAVARLESIELVGSMSK
jgi:hypothetical protein